MINFSRKSSSIILSFTTALVIGITSILYIQSIHGFSMSFGEDGTSHSSERTATLIVIKNVTLQQSNNTAPISNADRSIITANDFIMHVNGNNPSPFDFVGSESGTNISMGPGPYAVTETKPQLSVLGTSVIISSNYSKYCTGVIKDGETKTCKISDVIPTP